MSLNYINAQVKSRESIESTLTGIDPFGSSIIATCKGKTVEIDDNLWGLCGTTIEVLSTAQQSHPYDFNYLMDKNDSDTTYYRYVHFMADWIELIEEDKDNG